MLRIKNPSGALYVVDTQILADFKKFCDPSPAEKYEKWLFEIQSHFFPYISND